MAQRKCRLCREVEAGVVVGDHPFECHCPVLVSSTETQLSITEAEMVALKEQYVTVQRNMGVLWDMIDQVMFVPAPKLNVVR